ncbi:MAG: ATP-dependent DNA helicase [Alcanivorax sp.]|nr:ATP-dependent DNA helicase [Alcanivorax sp.]
MSTKRYTVAVRTLCDFTARRGDLDLRFTPAPSAREGIAGHQLVTSRRDDDYETEIPLQGEYRQLLLRGRADGYCPQRHVLEEIKTFRGDLNRMPTNHRTLHWAQLHCYGALFCAQRECEGITLALVYFDVVKQTETRIEEYWSRQALDDMLASHASAFLDWAVQEQTHRQARDTALKTLTFPHAEFRPGQRDLAEAVYTTLHQKQVLMAQAPTGIGKTLGTLFPALKALATREQDRLFFLTARTTGRQLALDALAQLDSEKTLPLRRLELIARDKACVYPEATCHGDSCPLARGFYDRLPAARQAAAEQGRLDQASLGEIAHHHQVCPYYLAQEMARWSDVVVGDYNYYFDLSALLFALTSQQQWQALVLVDEAHNLLSRSRDMYSASLDEGAIARLARHAPTALRTPLRRLEQAWQEMNLAAGTAATAYRKLPEPPQALLSALVASVHAISDYRNDHPTDTSAAVLAFYFDALQFTRIAEFFDEHYLCDCEPSPEDPTRTRLTLRNLVPAPFVRERLAAASGTVLFSATLTPPRFHADLLGLPSSSRFVDIPPPFDASQLRVHQVALSTRFQQRPGTATPIARLISRQFDEQPGNYLAFFSSFDYLGLVADALQQLAPHIPVHRQQPGMPETDRHAFLARFAPGNQQVSFAVLGGAFSEGIDLPGDRLVGSFIATLGLPQINPVNEQMRDRLEQLIPGAGFDYTYLYPGVQKVIQAAGRVIRTRDDRGVIYLIDERFARPDIRALLPPWWQPSVVAPPQTGESV